MQSFTIEKIAKIPTPPKRGASVAMEFLKLRDFSIFGSNCIVFSPRKLKERGTPSLDKGLAAFRTRKRPSRLRCFPSQVATTEDRSQEERLFSSTASNTPLAPMLRSIGRHLRQIYPKSGCSPSGRSSAHSGSLHTKFIFKSIECGLSTLPVLLQCRHLSLCEDHRA
jgi:hypothetical protein